jgi:hypothetical protein
MKTGTLRTMMWMALMYLLAATPSIAQTDCGITGPTSVGTNQSFTLCGPSGGGFEYEWYGPGLGSANQGRCVTARVSSTGTYEFLLVLSVDGAEVDRCSRIVNVGGSTGGAGSCAISGPTSIESGASARLCAQNDGLHTYSWTGPNGFAATGACVTVDEGGTYYLTSRNSLTRSVRQCVHQLTVIGTPGRADCDITGPASIAEGSTAQLCAPTRSNATYRWTGPQGFTASTRCPTVDMPGTYTVTIRSSSSGRSERCSHTLDPAGYGSGDDQDPDEVTQDNCPRPLRFWRDAFGVSQRGGGEVTGITQSDARRIAQRVDEKSTFFNWTNDVEGMRAALSPGSPLTRRKQVARQYAALLANVVTGELNLGSRGVEGIGLDLDTPVSFGGARTVRELIALTDRMLRANRGNYSRLNSTLTQINNAQGIGADCE